ncbi:hypothetical protein Aduo_008588 [Ancylostoma duodenale]
MVCRGPPTIILLMFALFPLVAAMDSCADPCGSVCILIYWLLVRVLADGEMDSDTLRGLKNVATNLKLLWSEVSLKLFTLKLHACRTVDSIQSYACRLSGRGARSERLQDLPENIVDILIKCLLEGLGIGQPELERSATELRECPTEFWISLGKTYEDRKAALKYSQYNE